MRKKSFSNSIAIMTQIILTFVFIYLFYDYAFSVNNAVLETFYFPLVSAFLVYILGIKTGFSIVKARNNETVGLINNLLLKMRVNKSKAKKKDNFVMQEEDVLKSFEKEEIKEKVEDLKEKKVESSREEKVKDDNEVSEFVIDKDNYF